MSYGLVTVNTIDDVPKLLQRCAQLYRSSDFRYYPEAWKKVADRMEALALDLHRDIPQMKAEEPQRKKPRIKL